MADFTPILPDINFWNHDGEKINLFCMSSKVQKVSQQWMSFKLFWRTAKKGGRLPGGEDLFSGRISRDIWPGGGLKANKYVQFCTSTALLFSLPHVKVLIKILNLFHLWNRWKILIASSVPQSPCPSQLEIPLNCMSSSFRMTSLKAENEGWPNRKENVEKFECKACIALRWSKLLVRACLDPFTFNF